MTEAAETVEVTEDDVGTADGMFEDAEGSMTVDLSNVDEASWDVLPKGVYAIIVEDAEYKLSSNNNPMISLTLEVEDGEFAGRKLFTHVVFSTKAMPMAKRTINRLGLSQLLEGPFNPEDAAEEFIGARARVRVVVDKWDGEDTNKVKQILPATDGEEFGEG